MTPKFKPGDRVAVYLGKGRITGVVTRINEGDILTVEELKPLGFGEAIAAHPKQCRKLKPRERRRVWISKQILDQLSVSGGDRLTAEGVIGAFKYADDCAEFIEAPRRKR